MGCETLSLSLDSALSGEVGIKWDVGCEGCERVVRESGAGGGENR